MGIVGTYLLIIINFLHIDSKKESSNASQNRTNCFICVLKNDFESIFVGIINYNMSLLDYLKVKKPNGIEDGKKVR